MGKNVKVCPRVAHFTHSRLPPSSVLAKMWATRQQSEDRVLKCGRRGRQRHMKTQWTEGDLLWVKIHGYPYWPCMVTKDPFTNQFYKYSDNNPPSISHHVQFFGVGCERSWTGQRPALEFKGREEFFYKAKEELHGNKYKVSAAWLSRLNYASAQAELARKLSKKSRMEQYEMKYVWGNTKRSLKTVLTRHFHYFPAKSQK